MFIYQEEIDGLRSIAIIPVIFYHAGLTTYFSGGYIGVDIFFVISGYLITSVIQNECEEGTFSLINFYERRCRRILPALFFILFLSSFFAYDLMLPEKLKELGETLISIICLSSNIYFWWKDDGYFSRLTELNPLVHRLLAFLRLPSIQTSQILMISLVFPLSIFSYFLVEQPFRNKRRFSRKQIFFISGLAVTLTFILGLFLIRTANTQFLILNKPGEDSYVSDLIKYSNHQYLFQEHKILKQKYKTFSNETNKKLILIGDSSTQDFYNMILEGKYLTNYEIRVYYIHCWCQMYLGEEDRTKLINRGSQHSCIKKDDIRYAAPLIKQANVIVLGHRWYEWSAERLPMTIKLLNLTKQQLLFVLGPKDFRMINTKLYVNKSSEYRIKQYQYPDKDIVKVNNLLEKTIDKSIYVNIMKMICNGFNQTCPLFTPNGKLISYDGMHLTKYGAIYIGNIIFRNKPLNKL